MASCKWGGAPLHCLKCNSLYGLSDGSTCVFDTEEEARAKLAEAAMKRAAEEGCADEPR